VERREPGNRVAGAIYGVVTEAWKSACLPLGGLVASEQSGGGERRYLSGTMFFPGR